MSWMACSMAAWAPSMANGWPAMIGGVLKALREAGYDKPVMGLHYSPAKDVMEVAGKEASDNYFIHGINVNSPEKTDIIKWIQDRGKANYGHERVAFLIEGFDSVFVLVQAIEKAQSLDPGNVKKAWENMDNMKTLFELGIFFSFVLSSL